MTITRVIDGKTTTIELTPEEVRNAYYAYEHQCDVQDIDTELERDDFYDDYGVSAVRLRPFIEEIAYEKRRQIDKYDLHWSEAVREAINDKIKEL